MKIATSAKTLFSVAAVAVVATSVMLTGKAHAAACTAPTTDYGTATAVITVPSTATYRLWSRMLAPDTINNTYMLEVDGATCYTVGGSMPASTWTWIDHASSASTTKVQQTLAQGAHTLKMIGVKPGVELDRVIAISDLTCVPNGFGDNCNVPDDTTLPTVALTAPAEGATVSGSSVAVAATASDNMGVSKVDFYDNSTLIGSDTSAPYQATWNTTTVANGSHLVSARAYDAAGNVSSDSNTVTVQNGDRQAPTTPMSVNATAMAYNKVTVSWQASTDNVAVVGYNIVRNGVPLETIGTNTSYDDTTVAPSNTYSYQISAFDAAGNTSGLSTAASATTPGVPDTQAPTAPTGVTATAVSTSQVNVSWQASTDNIGVVAYDVFRGNTRVATVAASAGTSYGDTGLNANTTYSYYVQARDAAGNVSAPSAVVSATTKSQVASAGISGVITDRATGQPLQNARAVVLLGKRNKIIAYTDSNGNYAVTLPAGGKYSVTYKKRGYFPQTVSITVADGQVFTQNIALVKQ